MEKQETTPVEEAMEKAIAAATARLEELQPLYSEYCKLLSTLRALRAVVSETPAPPALRGHPRDSLAAHILRIMSDGQARSSGMAAEVLSQDPAFAEREVSRTQIASRMNQLKHKGKLDMTLDGYVITDKGREA